MKIKNTLLESTPFIELRIYKKTQCVGAVRCYWSLNAGQYGNQVCFTAHDWTDRENCKIHEGKTNGYGYCKRSEGFARALSALGYERKLNAIDSIHRNPYHIGGNFHKINHTTLKKVLKNTTC